MEESGPLKRSVWRYPAWGTGTWKPDHIATVTVYYRTKTAADRWEGLTVLIFAALGIYMILKGIRKKKVLERRKDEIEWKKTTFLALITSVDAFFVGMGLGFLDTAMIEESLVLFPVTVLEAVIGIFAGYRLGLKENRRAYWVGGALLLLASFDVILHYYT